MALQPLSACRSSTQMMSVPLSHSRKDDRAQWQVATCPEECPQDNEVMVQGVCAEKCGGVVQLLHEEVELDGRV